AAMKLVSSLVRLNKADSVRQALAGVGVHGPGVAAMNDYAPQKHETTVWLGREYSLGFSAKLLIEVVVQDDEVDTVVDAIIKAARTGREGDGHVTVFPIEHRYNIHSGRRDVW